MYDKTYTAKTYASILLEECNHLYGGHPGDDTTVCVVKVRDRSQVNLMIGPPSDRKDTNKYMSLFFSKEGKHIVCGGTTSTLASEFLHKPMVADLNYLDPEIPPIAKIEGVDLVTEGVITLQKLVELGELYLEDNMWSLRIKDKHDGVSLLADYLFEKATDVNIFFGTAVNHAHDHLEIDFNTKMALMKRLEALLGQMGKNVKLSLC